MIAKEGEGSSLHKSSQLIPPNFSDGKLTSVKFYTAAAAAVQSPLGDFNLRFSYLLHFGRGSNLLQQNGFQLEITMSEFPTRALSSAADRVAGGAAGRRALHHQGQIQGDCTRRSITQIPPQAECQNFIRVIAKTDKQRMLICGTHAFKPKCRHYKYKVRFVHG
jgi:hypothetical protein